jgi:hypothetical protein
MQFQNRKQTLLVPFYYERIKTFLKRRIIPYGPGKLTAEFRCPITKSPCTYAV